MQLATAYNRLKRKDDAERERAIVDRLNAEAQAKQRGGGGSDRRCAVAMDAARLSSCWRRRWPRSRCGRQAAQPAAEGAGRRGRSRRRCNRPRRRRAASSIGWWRPATEARRRERWEEAIALYAKAVKLKPAYVEGYWYQGTAYYSLDKFPQCREAFRTVARLAPKNGAAYAFLGLCEFGLKDYDRSLQHLLQSRILGVGDTKDLGSVARYHAAVLMTRIEQYEQALETLGEFAGEGDDNPRVIEAMGIATLRMPLLPIETPPDRREMVLMAGRASYMMATRNTAAAAKAFEALVARYPETPNVHYAYGVSPAPGEAGQGDRGIQAGAETAAGACVVADADCVRVFEAGRWRRRRCRGRSRPSRPRRTRFPAHKALGQALLETGDVDGAIKELLRRHQARAGQPGPALQLARAYQRAGRAEDAAREREEFTRLDRLARTQRSGAQSVGGR